MQKWAIRRSEEGRGTGPHPLTIYSGKMSAIEVLERRLAEGELTVEKYRERRALLSDGPDTQPQRPCPRCGNLEVGTISIEQNKALVRRCVEEVHERGELDALGEFYAADCVDHTAPPGTPAGIGGLEQLFAATHAAFSDIAVSIEDMVAEGDTVVTRLTARGVHTGDFMGIAATKRPIEFTQISIDRIAGERIAEHWGLADQLALMQQLGAMPSLD